ncbi:MAG: hypothetical protein A3B90_02120 [Candidatus Magasanikbacteria bacterium RIFCSPHIGHO2_02_FULL_41_13]|uniref:Uncharacterized protein n=1 Tax=Candidatus Magasanikbacteria bacterium RIFCSPHIGHO2_02_FULL_41_13 TaxID=1798676 RepID=A0A1F6M5U9_9BACT|nr:MAG: hypothetical protein A3B90_02120 [Candidatus Magasanikbacteria bacterium RIFCSPHIGHO2_02_FULL_41_13]
MDYRDTQDWKGLAQAHRMGVSWAKIWAIIGALALMAIIGFAVSVFIGRQNAQMIERKIDEATQNAQNSQVDIQKNIQEQVNQKLREAGIQPVGE